MNEADQIPSACANRDSKHGVVHALLRALSSSPQIVALFDAEDRLRQASASFREAYMGGRDGDPTFDEIIRHASAQCIGPKIDSGDVEAFLAQVHSKRRQVAQRAFEADLLDGRWIWFTETLLDNGWLLTVGADITALKTNERTLRKAYEDALAASRTDPLTGLPNRRRLIEVVGQAVAARQATWEPISVAIIDIDHFKRINNTLGHEGGDRVLVHFASTCRAGLREGDTLGRFGGEEFVLAMPGCTDAEAADVVDRLRGELGGSEIPTGYTFSAGVAEASDADDVGSLLRRADMALYAAKSAGRNRVVREVGLSRR
jgi:diguanylate cyclase (GGDEF)-like protein